MQAVLTAAVESGCSKALFSKDTKPLADKWQQLASFEALFIDEVGTIQDAKGSKVGQRMVVASKADLQAAEAAARQPGYLVMDATDWKVIPAENLVATFQASEGKLLGVATSAADARVMLEALEAGTAGVVLRTDDPVQVKQLSAYLAQREAEGAPAYDYDAAKVTGVTPVGMCDRVCVDLCSLLRPGEGMLVGSFARALFLVHSECMESQYINSRPFRVNAGAVHAYIQAPNNKTAYLSELKSGSEVLVVDAAGRARTAVVGRCKVETRPMVRAGRTSAVELEQTLRNTGGAKMLVEAETADGMRHSTLLQNAETVQLVGPRASRPFRVNAGAVHAYIQAPNNKTAYLSELKSGSEVLVVDAAGRARTAVVGRCKVETRPMMLVEAETADGMRHSTLLQNAETVQLVGPRASRPEAVTSREGKAGTSSSPPSSSGTVQEPPPQHVAQPQWQAVAVTELQPGQHVYVLRQDGARHTGISIQETITEK
eukprot:GHUV01036105.1.p1 GENE.GHUV01036105.1~~GHUV01036105.1.p1  ORF type:complete len:487 (+),score=137.32 GHUV01036105.1:487-1947(+)